MKPSGIQNMKRGEKMKQSTKKLTALFLSMCMTASMVSVSAVSASALDGDENAAVDISGNSEFEYTGHFTGKYVSSSGDKLVTVTTEYLDGVYVTAKSGNTFLSYTPGEKSVYFIAEKGKEYEFGVYFHFFVLHWNMIYCLIYIIYYIINIA